jgi:hypothetical protein
MTVALEGTAGVRTLSHLMLERTSVMLNHRHRMTSHTSWMHSFIGCVSYATSFVFPSYQGLPFNIIGALAPAYRAACLSFFRGSTLDLA